VTGDLVACLLDGRTRAGVLLAVHDDGSATISILNRARRVPCGNWRVV
jgi:hypothetical protein